MSDQRPPDPYRQSYTLNLAGRPAPLDRPAAAACKAVRYASVNPTMSMTSEHRRALANRRSLSQAYFDKKMWGAASAAYVTHTPRRVPLGAMPWRVSKHS
eukprot:5513046-Prymnesium_polylepis.1